MDAEDKIACELAGITTRSLREAYRDLEEKVLFLQQRLWGKEYGKFISLLNFGADENR
jgi:hypothetical protein